MVTAFYATKPVQITDVMVRGTGRKLAWIENLDGTQFERFSFQGGSYMTDTIAVPIGLLSEIEIPECNCVLPEQSCEVCRTRARLTYSDPEEIPFY